MQKKKCPILQLLGIVLAVAAAVVALPKVVKWFSGKCSKDDVDDMEFEFEDKDSEFMKPEPMKSETVETKERTKEEDIFEEE